MCALTSTGVRLVVHGAPGDHVVHTRGQGSAHGEGVAAFETHFQKRQHLSALRAVRQIGDSLSTAEAHPGMGMTGALHTRGYVVGR